MRFCGYGTPVVWTDRRMLGVRYGIGFAHAMPDGSPVLRGLASWRTVAGVWINTPVGAVWLYFRRWAS